MATANVPIGKAGFAGTMEAAGIEPANDSYRLLRWFSSCLESRADEMFSGRETFLYVIEDVDCGAFKFGISNDIGPRFRNMQCCTPHELALVTWVTATKEIERLLHSVLLHDQIRGEWFAGTPDVLSFVGEFEVFSLRYGDDATLSDFRTHFVNWDEHDLGPEA